VPNEIHITAFLGAVYGVFAPLCRVPFSITENNFGSKSFATFFQVASVNPELYFYLLVFPVIRFTASHQ
jgi:hypothetical protein